MSMTANLILNPMDRIPQLPEFIIHEILFRLPTTKEVAQTIVLSKTWRGILSTFPILDYDQILFGQELESKYPSEKYSEMRNKFLNFVSNTMQRFHEHKLPIKKFKLYITLADFEKLAPLVDKWIRMAVERKVEELCLNIETQDTTCYSLPQMVFDAESLKVLELWGCKLELPMKTSTKFYPLRKLSLNEVHVDDQMIQYLFSSYPLIECITLISDYGLPLLENLCIEGCSCLEGVKISCKNLKDLTLVNCKSLVEAEINAPNLLNFHYAGDIKPLLSSKDGAGQWEAYLTLYSNRHLDIHWFVKLTEFLAKSNMFKLLSLSIASHKFPASTMKNRFSVEEVKVIHRLHYMISSIWH